MDLMAIVRAQKLKITSLKHDLWEKRLLLDEANMVIDCLRAENKKLRGEAK